MNVRLLERLVALAAVALLATLGSLALVRAGDRQGEPADAPARQGGPTRSVMERWYEAPVEVYGHGCCGRAPE